MYRQLVQKIGISALALLALAACEGNDVKDTLGLTRHAPDEFRVVSRPALNVPPEFNLRPPAEAGEASGLEKPAAEEAKSLVFGTQGSGLNPGNAPTAVLPVTSSELPGKSAGETAFLKKAGADMTDESIRTKLRKDYGEEQDKGFLEKLRDPNSNQPQVDAKKEAERLQSNKAAGKPVTEGETPNSKNSKKSTLETLFDW